MTNAKLPMVPRPPLRYIHVGFSKGRGFQRATTDTFEQFQLSPHPEAIISGRAISISCVPCSICKEPVRRPLRGRQARTCGKRGSSG